MKDRTKGFDAEMKEQGLGADCFTELFVETDELLAQQAQLEEGAKDIRICSICNKTLYSKYENTLSEYILETSQRHDLPNDHATKRHFSMILRWLWGTPELDN